MGGKNCLWTVRLKQLGSSVPRGFHRRSCQPTLWVAAGALALLMLAALYFVHLNSGLFIADGGFEYVLVLIVSLLMIVVFGSGRASIDGVLSR